MIATLAPAIPTIRNQSGNADFDITRYLQPNVMVEHEDLKHIIYAAYNAGLNCHEGDIHWREGTTFRQAIYLLWEMGWIMMTEAVDRFDHKTDFYESVFMAYPSDHKLYKVVEGYLMLCDHSEQMLDVEMGPDGELQW